jgi:hypothetical protein
MFKPSLVALALVAGLNVYAAENPGAQAVRYLSGRAEDVARSIKSPLEFAATGMDEYQFYHTFVSYMGASYLPVELLGSWEFADRIENLTPYWSPYNQGNIDRVREMAKEARKKTGVKYYPSEAWIAPHLWWNEHVAASVEKMAAGEFVATKDIPDLAYSLIIRAASRAGVEVKLQYERGTWKYIDDHRVWVTDRFEAIGVPGPINHYSSSHRSELTLIKPKYRQLGRSGGRFKQWPGPLAIIGGFSVTKMSVTGEIDKLKNALAFEQMPKVLEGYGVNVTEGTVMIDGLRQNTWTMGMHFADYSKGKSFQLTHDSLNDFSKRLPRVKGVKPETLCAQKTLP